MAKRVGFIVLDEDRWPMRQMDGVLSLAGFRHATTIFPTKRRAEQAIERTRKRASELGYDWKVKEWRIWPVAFEETPNV